VARGERIAADLLEQCREEGSVSGASATVLRGVGGDVATLVEIDLTAGQARRHGSAPNGLERVVPRLYPYLSSHPVPALMHAHHSLRPVRVTDVQWWRRSTARAELAAHMGMHYQLIIPLRATPRSCCALGLMRAGRDFTDREADLAEWLQPVLLGWWYRRARSEPPARDTVALTPRERQVLALLAAGLTVPAIGHRLGISPHTAARHTERIHRKLGTHDRASTVLRAQRLFPDDVDPQ